MSVQKTIKRVLRCILNVPEGAGIKTSALIATRLILNKPPIDDRWQLPLLLSRLNLNGKGAEIGVWEGEFSDDILAFSRLAVLYSVDPWKTFDANLYADVDNVSQEEFEKKYDLTTQRLEKYKTRSKIIRSDSRNASRLFDSETLDFIYIDANHSYEACKGDLELWWPKLREKGIFAGHDYLNGLVPEGVFGVKSAVDEFAAKHKQRVYVTREEYPSWYLIKNSKIA